MRIGLIGLQNSGKTTIFNALTGADCEVTPYASMKAEPNLAMVEVFDERIKALSDMYNPKKTIYAQIEYIDFVGMSADEAGSGAFSASTMADIKTTDAIALVVRNFDDGMQGTPDAVADVDSIESELVLADLIIIENRIEKIELGYKRGIKTAAIQFEEKVLRKLAEYLNEGKSLRTIELSEEEEKTIRGFQFISRKPLLVILNSEEDNFGKNNTVIEQLKDYSVIEFAGKFEMELSGLDDEEKEMFMDDIGIKESARDRLTNFSYDLLGYISFFTVGTDEVRAWTIRKGDSALEAAGKIHSDLARGFIRAECFLYEDILEHGSEKIVKEKGLFRLEGKEYIVKDGEIVHIRFNV